MTLILWMVGGLVALVVFLVVVRLAIRRFAPAFYLASVGAHAGCDLVDLGRLSDDPLRLLAAVDAKLTERFTLLCFRTRTLATPLVGAAGDPYFVIPRLMNLAAGELTLPAFRQLHSIITNDLGDTGVPELEQIHEEFHILAEQLEDTDRVRHRLGAPARQ